MQEQFKEKKRLIKKSYYEVNKYISLQIYESELKLVIYIKNESIITVPSLNFPLLDYIFKDINDDLVCKKFIIKNENIREMFQKLALNLKNWAINNYDTLFLPYKMAFPLLKKLKEVGETKFQIIFQQEILKRFSNNSVEVKNFLEREGYLKLIGDFF